MDLAEKGKTLDGLFDEVRGMDSIDILRNLDFVSLLKSKEQKREFSEVCLDYLNDRYYCERLGVNYINPSAEDIDRVKVFVYLAEFCEG